MSEERLTFASEPYGAALMAAVNANGRYRMLASGWEGAVYLNIADRERCLWLDLHHGTCRGFFSATSPDDKPAPFVYTATLANWQKICEGQLNPVTAMATMKLKVKGNMAQVMRYSQASVAMVKCALVVPTSWDVI
jgi:putative sterol carrier protein